jgi:hypothetical protein
MFGLIFIEIIGFQIIQIIKFYTGKIYQGEILEFKKVGIR